MVTLLLDVMDTIVWDPFRLMPSFFECDWKDLVEGRTPDTWHAFERDEISEAQFLSTFFADGRTFDHDAFTALFVDNYRFLDGMEGLLGELSAAAVPMHALSNYPRWSLRIEDKLALSRFLDWGFVSWKTGVRKPDPRAYLGAAEALGLPPGDCLFVDDRESNCEAARAIGMPAVRFEGADALRDTLVQRGVLPGAGPGRG